MPAPDCPGELVGESRETAHSAQREAASSSEEVVPRWGATVSPQRAGSRSAPRPCDHPLVKRRVVVDPVLRQNPVRQRGASSRLDGLAARGTERCGSRKGPRHAGFAPCVRLCLLFTPSTLSNVDFRPAGSMMAGMITLILTGLLRGIRTHRALVLENLALRHQLAVLQRSAPRPRLRRPTGCSGSCYPACGTAGRMPSPSSNPRP